MSISSFFNTSCQSNIPDSTNQESDEDAHRACRLLTKCYPLINATLFAWILCSLGCIALSENGLTISLAKPSQGNSDDKTVEMTGSSKSSEEQQRQASSHRKSTFPLESKLNIDHWRAMPVWPKPIAGRDAFASLQEKPLFRWQHQGLIDYQPEEIAENSMKNYAEHSSESTIADQHSSDQADTTDVVETGQPDSEQSEIENRQAEQVEQNAISPSRDPFVEFVPELKQLATRDDLTGWNATILLAQYSPGSVLSEHLSRLQEIALKKIDFDTKSGSRIEDQPNETHPGDLQEVKTTGMRNRLFPQWPNRLAEQKQLLSDEMTEFSSKQDAEDVTEETVSTISDSMRAAAAESWCFALAMQSGNPKENFSVAGRVLEDQEIPESVRMELLRGIARKIKPRRIPTLSSYLTESQLQQRVLSPLSLAALDCCICYAVGHPQEVRTNRRADEDSVITFDTQSLDPLEIWPEKIWDLRWHQDTQVVNRYGLWLALTEHPVAQNYLATQLNHLEAPVQNNAIRNLGLLDSDTSLKKLREIVETRPGTARAVGLMAIGDRDEEFVYQYLQDESPTVRTAMAHFAGKKISVESMNALQELAQGDDLKVQHAAIDAVEDWPNEKAFPVLSAAFASGGIATRNRTRKKLEQRFGIVVTALEDDVDQRKRILDTIRHKFHIDSQPDRDLFHERHSQTDPKKPAQEQVVSQLQELLTEIAQEQTKSFRQERLTREVKLLIEKSPEALDEVLNQLGFRELKQTIEQLDSLGIAEVELIVRLEDKRLPQRRKAARAIAQQAGKENLSHWELQLIAEKLQQEQDPHVCRDLMLTITKDTSAQARAVAQNSLVHTWPDVRILGCQYVQKHRLPQLAPFLLPLLQERNISVQQAAIAACGYSQNPVVIDGFSNSSDSQQRSGLRSLLGTVNHQTELMVIAGLARLGDEQGRSELLKLSYSPDANIRQQVIGIMGELQDQNFVEHLIRIGWTEPTPHVRLAVLGAMEKIVPDSQQPKIVATATPEKQMQIWSDWLDKQ